MTIKQIGILAGLAIIACLLFGSMSWLALRDNGVAKTPSGAPVLQSTATPWIIPSAISTGTATLLPYETLIPRGWSQFKTELVEIWLPAQFGPGDPQFFNNSANTAIGELILTDSSPESSPYRMLVIVSYEPLTGESLDSFLDAEIAKLSTDFRVAQRSDVTLNGTGAVRFVFETRFNNLEVNDLTYVFLDGGTVWHVEYIAQINEFFEMLSMFDKSAQTFRVVR